MGGMGDVVDELQEAGELIWSALLGTMKAVTRLEQAQEAFARALGSGQESDHRLLKARRALKDAPAAAAVEQIRAARKSLEEYLVSVGSTQRFPALADLENITDREFSTYVLLPSQLRPPGTPPKVYLVCDGSGNYQPSAYLSVQSSSGVVVTAPEPPDLQGDKLTVAAILATCVISVLVNRFRRGPS